MTKKTAIITIMGVLLVWLPQCEVEDGEELLTTDFDESVEESPNVQQDRQAVYFPGKCIGSRSCSQAYAQNICEKMLRGCEWRSFVGEGECVDDPDVCIDACPCKEFEDLFECNVQLGCNWVECTDDSDCDGSYYCSDNKCKSPVCIADYDCSGTTPFCIGTGENARCVECRTSADCTDCCYNTTTSAEQQSALQVRRSPAPAEDVRAAVSLGLVTLVDSGAHGPAVKESLGVSPEHNRVADVATAENRPAPARHRVHGELTAPAQGRGVDLEM